MKQLIIGGIYNMGIDEEHTSLRVVTNQDNEFIEMYYLNHCITQDINQKDEIIKTIYQGIMDGTVPKPLTLNKVAVKIVKENNYISGYLGQVPDSILNILNGKYSIIK